MFDEFKLFYFRVMQYLQEQLDNWYENHISNSANPDTRSVDILKINQDLEKTLLIEQAI